MIKGASEMVDDLTREHLKPQCDSRRQNELLQFLEGLPIFIGNDWFSSVIVNGEGHNGGGRKKIGNFPIEILDVLIGPF
jgi:hypothetical protein